MQGILFYNHKCAECAKLWALETNRVYRDKVADPKDIQTYDNLFKDVLKNTFDEIANNQVLIHPLIYCHFAKGLGEPKYMSMPSWDSLNRVTN